MTPTVLITDSWNVWYHRRISNIDYTPTVTTISHSCWQALTVTRLAIHAGVCNLNLRMFYCSRMFTILFISDELNVARRPLYYGMLVDHTYSGRFTHISGHPSATDRAQDRKFAGQRLTFYRCARQPIQWVRQCSKLWGFWINRHDTIKLERTKCTETSHERTH